MAAVGRCDHEADDGAHAFSVLGPEVGDVVQAGHRRSGSGVAPPDRPAVDVGQEPARCAAPDACRLVAPVIGAGAPAPLFGRHVLLHAVARRPARIIGEGVLVEEPKKVVQQVRCQLLDRNRFDTLDSSQLRDHVAVHDGAEGPHHIGDASVLGVEPVRRSFGGETVHRETHSRSGVRDRLDLPGYAGWWIVAELRAEEKRRRKTEASGRLELEHNARLGSLAAAVAVGVLRPGPQIPVDGEPEVVASRQLAAGQALPDLFWAGRYLELCTEDEVTQPGYGSPLQARAGAPTEAREQPPAMTRHPERFAPASARRPRAARSGN